MSSPGLGRWVLPFAEGENDSSSHGRTCTSPVLDGVEFVVPEKPLDWDVKKVKEYVDTPQRESISTTLVLERDTYMEESTFIETDGSYMLQESELNTQKLHG